MEGEKPRKRVVALLAQTIEQTGNDVTINRIKDGLCDRFDVRIYAIHNNTSTQRFVQDVQSGKVDCALGLHAYRAGLPLLQHAKSIPFAIIIGGTDVNEMIHEESKRIVIKQCFRTAKAIVCFSDALHKRVQDISREFHLPSVYIIPQAVQEIIGKLITGSSFQLRKHLHLGSGSHIFLLLASLRDVKDPFFLNNVFRKWYRRDPNVHLVIAGKSLDSKLLKIAESYGDCLSPSYQGVSYIGVLSSSQVYAAMKQATAVVNTSISEGQCGVILEAMYLQTPVLARANEGNAAIVKHARTGFLFKDPDDFVRQAQSITAAIDLQKTRTLLHQPVGHDTPDSSCQPSCDAPPLSVSTQTSSETWTIERLKQVTDAAHNYVLSHHTFEVESAGYMQVVDHVLADTGGVAEKQTQSSLSPPKLQRASMQPCATDAVLHGPVDLSPLHPEEAPAQR
eukprot:g1769.t1